LFSLAASSLPFVGQKPWVVAENLHGMGFGSWELIIEDELTEDELERTKETVDGLGLETSIHAPFSDLNIASLNGGVLELSINKIEKAVEAAAHLGADPVTVHPGRFSPSGLFYPERVKETNMQSLGRLLDFSRERGVTLCLENPPEFPGSLCPTVTDMEQILEAVPGLGLTLDIGHANTSGPLKDFLTALSRWIGHIHIHDNDQESDRHLHLGGGTMDLHVLGRFLRGFSKTVVIETHEVEDIGRSREVLEGIVTGSS
jgi:sugar phosphate isomerase/epimerase